MYPTTSKRESRKKIYLSPAFLCCIFTTAAGIRVLNVEANRDHMNPGWLPGPDSGAGAVLRDPRFPTSTDFTACLRLQFLRLKRVDIVLSVLTNGTRPLLQIELNVEKIRVVTYYQYRYVFLERWLQPRRWYCVCILYQHEDLNVTTVVDGQVAGTSTLLEITPAKPKIVSFGFLDPHVYSGISFIGNVTQFNMWTRILSTEELKDIASCKRSPQGNFISWDGDWILREVKEYDLELEDLCPKELPPGFQVFPAMDHVESTYLCEALGGTLRTPKTVSEATQMYLRAQGLRPECNLMWTALTDEEEEEVWRYRRSSVVVSDLPWSFNEPNGLQYENCGGIDLEGMADNECHSKRCPICDVADNVAMMLRGSCEAHTYNINFMMLLKNNEMTFEGYGDYRIVLINNTWTWMDSQKDVIAKMIPSVYNYPMGRQLWQLRRLVCDQEAGGTRFLLLTRCVDGQFTCTDGTCVNLSQRCDLKYDCYDSSDEAECEMVRLPVEYKTNVAPRPTSIGGKGGGGPHGLLQILANVSLENIRVDTSEMILETSFNLSLTWYETRATYVILKESVSLNLVDPNITKLWLPSVGFVNTIDNAVTVTDHQTSMHVVRAGPPSGADDSVPEEVRLYPGSENPIVNSRMYQGLFTCDFDLSAYPFDHQTCFMMLKLRTASRDDIRWDIEGSWVQYLGNPLLLEYELGDIVILPRSARVDDTVLWVRIPLVRRVGYAVISIYLPSLTMLLIGYLTLFFLYDNDNFEVRVMTALTTLLVMATLFTQVSSSLPKTSYFKLVDVWLLFCIFATFLIIVFHIVIDLLLNKEKNLTKGLGGEFPDRKILVSGIGSRTLRSTSKDQMGGVLRLGAWQKEEQSVQWHQRVTVKGVEKFARLFIAAVFLVFNIFYWLTAYKIV